METSAEGGDMHPRHVQFRAFKCLKCGTVAQYPKYGERTGIGHIKTVWCYRCRRSTRHVQISKGG